MCDLHTTYMGLRLDNPIIVSSGPLTASLDSLKKCEDAGAGAVVLKSIFEEQIERQGSQAVEEQDEYLSHADAEAFVSGHTKEKAVEDYLLLISQAKQSLGIPVIASVNAKSDGAWIDYAKRFAKAGCDALEINYYVIGADSKVTGEKMEKQFVSLVRKTRKAVSIPLALKLGPNYTSLANLLHTFEDAGVNGAVLFNRFFQNDIDIDRISLKQGLPLSGEQDYLNSMRWIALMSAELVHMDLCGSCGIWSGETVVKELLAGAKAVSICSAAMKSGLQVIGKMRDVVGAWMDSHGYGTIGEFQGKLAQEHMSDPSLWERSQYMKALSGK